MTVHLYKCYWPDHVVTIWTQYLAILFPENQEPVFTQQKTRTSKDYLEARELVVLLFDLSLILFYKKKKKRGSGPTQSMAELPQGWCAQLLLAPWQHLVIKHCFLSHANIAHICFDLMQLRSFCFLPPWKSEQKQRGCYSQIQKESIRNKRIKDKQRLF